MKSRTDKLQELLTQALDCADAQERADYLSRACGGDRRLLKEVEELVEAHHISEGFLHADPRDAGVGLLAAAEVSLSESAGTQIGPYKLLEQIGEGGFAVVYVADQQEPVHRRVALKIIKLGMDTRQVIARFEAERQALAMMDHPHIAKVLDAGATETGRPYFVMELVRGIPITEFCDQNRLSVRQRLELFIPVCQAVQHAHQKGVIHRDLKPSNILVTMADGRPHPLVIDFGVAKAVNHRLTEKTVYTRFAQMIGTPAYMSPEQAQMSRDDVDTRSDIYSLGVLLYELLTGTTPFPEERLREAGFAEIQRIIREEEPERPSTLGSRAGERPRSLVGREDEPGNLTKLLRGDLDWITLKAIDKDRNRRYETANGLAADLQRHLSDEPVTASPPSTLYQLSKFARRHRTTVVAGVAMTLTLMLGAGLATWQAMRATKAEQLAAERLATAEEEHAKAEEETGEALRQSKENEAIHRWLIEGLLRMPEGGTPVGQERQADITLKEALLEAAGSLDEHFADQPVRGGKIGLMIGNALRVLNARKEAGEQLRRAYELLSASLGPNDTNTLKAQSDWGFSLAFDYYRPTSPAFSSTHHLGQEGLKLVEDAYEKQKTLFGREDVSTLHAAFLLGTCYVNGAYYGSNADLARAEDLIPEAAAAAERIARTDSFDHFVLKTRALGVLSYLRQLQGRISEARNLTEASLELREQRRRAMGEDTPHDNRFAHYHWRLGWLHLWEREYELAAEEARTGLEISLKQVGNGYPTENLFLVLSVARRNQDRFEEAAEAGRRYLEIQEEGFGPEHAETLYAARRVVDCYAMPADWPAASKELVRQRERGIVDGRSLAYEILIGHLMADLDRVPQLRRTFWEWVADHPQAGPDYPTLQMLLTLPLPEAELGQVLALVQQGLSSSPASGWAWERKALLNGLVAWREGRFGESLAPLRTVAHNLRNRRLAALARYYVALILHHEGQTTESKAALEQANDLLNRLLRGGNLDLPHPNDQWSTLASALLARDQAESTILGRIVSEPVTRESLEAARAAWKPVHDLLLAMEDAARDQDYAEAHRLYLQVRAHPLFDWEIAEQDIPWLSGRVATILVQAGAREDYVTFLNEIRREETTPSSGYHLSAGMISPWELPPQLESYIRTATLAHEQEQERKAAAGQEVDYWGQHHLGVAFLRMGRYEEALEHLKVGMECPKHDCALSSTAHAALAAWKLGRTEEARTWRQEAEEGLRMRLEAGAGRLDPNWPNLSRADLALKKIRRLMDEESPAVGSDQTQTTGPPGIEPDIP